MTAVYPDAADALIDSFAALYPWTADPYQAAEQCFFISEAFVDHLDTAGVRGAELISGVVTNGRLVLYGHAAVSWAGLVYDWTARQFDSRLPWPLIQPVEEWRLTWAVYTPDPTWARRPRTHPHPNPTTTPTTPPPPQAP